MPAVSRPQKDHSLTPDFEFRPLTRIVFGRGRIAELGALAREQGFRRTLVVSDPGVVAAGHAARGFEALREAGVEAFLFDAVEENPTTRHVDRGVEFARQHRVDSIVGLGGGSSMDCAKGVNFLVTNGGQMADYWGVDRAARPMLPMIAVPTTAGTGSETQSFALISDPGTHQKMACGDRKAACRVALLDPELTLSLPREVTAATGMDAISHAVESHVTTLRNPISQAFSRQAWALLAPGFERVLDCPDDLEARGRMLLGASLAGLAIENSMLGAAHSLANPLTARHGVPHGVAVGLMLPHIVRFNGADLAEEYAQLAALDGSSSPSGSGAEGVATRIEALRLSAGLASRLADWGVEETDLGALARRAAGQWTAQFNPRPVTARELEDLYRCAL